ncbi:hypothetical protein L9F63_001483, partial [Diploptera punctata]
ASDWENNVSTPSQGDVKKKKVCTPAPNRPLPDYEATAKLNRPLPHSISIFRVDPMSRTQQATCQLARRFYDGEIN